jgi:radical SAM protein with 4Fe4S-binding SPASM domain
MSDRENVEHIESVKYTDVEQVLTEAFGERFGSYRKNYRKSLNYDTNGYIPPFPLTVSLEFVNRCNLSCQMCYTINHSDKKATLDLSDIAKIMDECAANELPAAVVGMGSEALIYKGAQEAIRKIREAGVMDLFLGTNGVLLNEQLCEFLVEQRVARIEVSLDAATPETYHKIRGKNELARIEENLERLIQIRKRAKSKLPVIRLCFCVQKDNLHEQRAFLEKWKNRVDYIDFQEMVDFGQVDEFRDMGAEAAVPADLPAPSSSYCAYPFNSLHVWSNGDVTPCCTFFGKALVIGNAKDASLSEIWNGEELAEIRRQLLEGDLNKVCHACLTCRDKENFAAAGEVVHEDAILQPVQVPAE